jgi:uncharacterized membrane protein
MYRLLIWLKDAQNRRWVKPAIGSMVAVLVAALAALGNQLIPPGILPEIERETLDALLGVIASSMLVVATFSLSIMVSAFSSAAAGASPRATQLVASDESTQNAISSFISAFIFAVIANTALGLQLYGPEGRFILFVSTMLVLVFLIYTLVRWVKTLSMLGRMENTLSKIEAAASRAIRQHRAAPGMGARVVGGPAPHGTALFADRVGYVRHIDMSKLQSLATQCDAQLHLRARPGTLVHPGSLLLVVAGVKAPDADALREAFVLGDGRSFDQDPRFGLIVLCEVAQRALSPAVNDPGTAIDAMNTMTRVLVDARPGDDDGPAESFDRLSVLPLDEADFIHQGFDPIARDSAGVAEVHMRMQKLLSVIAQHCPGTVGDAARRQAATSLRRAEQALALDQDKTCLRELHAELHGRAAEAA